MCDGADHLLHRGQGTGWRSWACFATRYRTEAGWSADPRLLLACSGEIEAESSGFRLPSLEQCRPFPWSFGLPCAQGGQFHPLGCTVAIGVGRAFDRLPALRKGALDVAGDRGKAEARAMAFDRMAIALESIGKVGAVDSPGFLLGLIEVSADKAAPASVTAGRKPPLPRRANA